MWVRLRETRHTAKIRGFIIKPSGSGSSIMRGGGQVLVQKRSKYKKQNPLKWDIPSAGHVDYKEDLLTTCMRETEEELGITLPKEKFVFLFETFNEKGWEFGENYLVEEYIPIEQMTIQIEEVEEVKWLSFDEFKKLLYSEEFCGYQIEYKDKISGVLGEKLTKE